MKIAKRISLSFSVVLAILMGISLFTFYLIARNNLKGAINEHLNTTAQSRAHHIETYLAEHKIQIGMIASSTSIENMLEATISNDPDSTKLMEQTSLELEQFAKEDPQLHEIFIINPDGKILVSTDENHIGLDRSTDAYFLEAMTGIYIKDAYYSKTTKKYSIAVSAPVLDKETTDFLGVIVSRFYLEDLDNITTDRTGLGKTGETYLVNKDKYMITSSRFTENEFLEQRVDTENVNSCFANEAKNIKDHWHKKVHIFPDYRGVSVLGTHVFIPEMKWGLLVEIDAKEAFAPLARIKYFAIIIFCFALCTVYGISISISKAITAPIDRLREGTEIIGAGNLDHKVGTTAKDEVGQLSRAFDQMTVNLQKTTASRDKLDAANQQLTASEQQLKATNQQLRAGEQQLKAANQQLKAGEQQLKATNQQLKASTEQAEFANKAKSQFLANMSHEIRTPMNVIMGFADLLDNEDLNDEQKASVGYIQQSSKSLLRLIEDILDVSKIEAGKLDIGKAEFSLDQLLSSVKIMMQISAEAKDLRFDIIRIGQLPTIIRTDYDRVHQCLVNLIGNAIKFTEKGYVHLRVTLKDLEGKPFICFDVEDTGIGIPPDKHDIIFETFSQADSSNTRKYGGTGLGLTITKQLVKLLGGTFSFTSEEGKGSIFTIMIPAGIDMKTAVFLDNDAQNREPTSGPLTEEAYVFSGSVLLAEDDPGCQVLAKKQLASFGVEVTIVENGNEAIEAVSQQSFDLILMDMQMPELNGYQATTKLIEQGVTTPIVAVTAYAMSGDRAKCLEAGCVDYISKPFTKDDLTTVLQKYLSSMSDPI